MASTSGQGPRNNANTPENPRHTGTVPWLEDGGEIAVNSDVLRGRAGSTITLENGSQIRIGDSGIIRCDMRTLAELERRGLLSQESLRRSLQVPQEHLDERVNLPRIGTGIDYNPEDVRAMQAEWIAQRQMRGEYWQRELQNVPPATTQPSRHRQHREGETVVEELPDGTLGAPFDFGASDARDNREHPGSAPTRVGYDQADSHTLAWSAFHEIGVAAHILQAANGWESRDGDGFIAETPDSRVARDISGAQREAAMIGHINVEAQRIEAQRLEVIRARQAGRRARNAEEVRRYWGDVQRQQAALDNLMNTRLSDAWSDSADTQSAAPEQRVIDLDDPKDPETEETMQEPETPACYTIEAICGNCGFNGEVSIQKGTPVDAAACETCGCAGTLKRIQGNDPNRPEVTINPDDLGVLIPVPQEPPSEPPSEPWVPGQMRERYRRQNGTHPGWVRHEQRQPQTTWFDAGPGPAEPRQPEEPAQPEFPPSGGYYFRDPSETPQSFDPGPLPDFETHQPDGLSGNDGR